MTVFHRVSDSNVSFGTKKRLLGSEITLPSSLAIYEIGEKTAYKLAILSSAERSST